MSVEQRLRSGLSANTQDLQPDMDRELSNLLRRARRRRRARVAFSLAALATAAILAVVWLPAATENLRSADDGDFAAQPTPSLAPIKLPVPHTRRLHELEPGRYQVPAGSRAGPRILVDIPQGFFFDGPWPSFDGLHPHPPQKKIRGVNFWYANRVKVYTPFCATHGQSLQDPGPTVPDLAKALSNQPHLMTAEPIPTTIDGYDGLYVPLTAPADRKCFGILFRARLPHDYLATGIVDRFWILDVDGTRIVVDAFYGPDVSDDQVDELTRIVESTTFLIPKAPTQ